MLNTNAYAHTCDLLMTRLSASSDAMRQLCEQLAPVIDTRLFILLHGPSGSGKGHLARLIHELSPWSTGRFFAINCPALPPELAKSALFGHVRGAFTGANNARRGALEIADEGTLFLDEIGDLHSDTASALRAPLTEGSFTKIGGDAEKRFNTRLIAATSQGIESIDADLANRFIHVHVPGLDERREEIPGIAHALAKHAGVQLGEGVIEALAGARLEQGIHTLWLAIERGANPEGLVTLPLVETVLNNQRRAPRRQRHTTRSRLPSRRRRRGKSKEATTRALIGALASNGECTRRDLEVITGVARSTAQYALKTLVKLGAVEMLGKPGNRGVTYKLSAQHPANKRPS